MEAFNKQFNSVFVPEFSRQLIDDVQTVWQAIASDCQEFCEDNESAVEMCIDANRLATFANKSSDDEVQKLSTNYGYSVVIKALSNEITLV
jgi:hypothetical protein